MRDAAVALFFPEGLWMSHCLRRWLSVLGAFVAMSIRARGTARADDWGTAHADDWGCQVILCLSSPIKKLWAAPRHGDPLPTCDSGSGGSQGASALNTFASAAYCREELLYRGGPEHSELLCNARGAINVEINGALYTWVWWDVRGAGRTITEFYGGGSTAIPYDPTYPARLFLERESESSGGQGGCE